MVTQTTPIPTLTPEQLLKAAQRAEGIEALQAIGEKCFSPYAEAISSREYKQSYIKNLPGRQGYTAVFKQLNEQGLTQGVNSLDGQRHIFQQCHYEACYPQEIVSMDQPTYDQTASQVRELFAPVMEPGEEIKVFRGQTVELNDGGIIGKLQNRLSAETVKVITDALSNEQHPKGDIQYTNDSQERRKVSQIEVLAIKKDPETGEKSTRILLRQERDFVVSANLLNDLQLNSGPATVEPTPKVATAEAPENIETTTVEETAEIATTKAPTDIEPVTVEEATPIAFQPTATRQPKTYSHDAESIKNTLRTLNTKVSELPASHTKQLWERINGDLQSLGQQTKQLADNVKAVPAAVTTDTKASIAEGWKKLRTLQTTLQTTLEQTTTADLKSRAIADTSKVAEAGSRQLGRAATYLQKRAVMAKNYGMAKSALKVFETGHARTGEAAYQAGNYKVEAKEAGYTVYNEKNQQIMSFGTNQKGEPISVTKEPTATENDNRALNQLSRRTIIKGSEKGEQVYQRQLQAVITGTKAIVSPDGVIDGQIFHVERDGDNGLTISTQAAPHRTLIVDSTGNIESSNLTRNDLAQLETSIEQSTEQQDTQPVAIESEVKEKEQITV